MIQMVFDDCNLTPNKCQTEAHGSPFSSSWALPASVSVPASLTFLLLSVA